MAEILSDSPLSVPSGLGREQSSAMSSHKRSNRNRKQRQQSAVQSDGMVSESALNSAISPRPKKSNRARQNLAASPGSIQQTPGRSPILKQRPISLNAPGVESPAKEQAYAGPTFQSSPAASALPMPKFFAKSAPTGMGETSLQARLAGETSPESNPSSPESDTAHPSVPLRETQQSPLDIFFKADRAEREKMRAASHSNSPKMTNPTQWAHGANGSSSTPLQDVPFSGTIAKSQDKSYNHSPYGLSPSQASSRAVSSPAHIKVPSSNGDEERQAYTQSLKDILFNTAAQQAATPPRQKSNLDIGLRYPDSVYFTPSPFQRPPSGPTTPQNGVDQQNIHGLHYGNRNLSPLFKAAQSDSPSRPSSLRQEVSCDGVSTTDSAIDVNSPPLSSIHRPSHYRHYQASPQRSDQADFRFSSPGPGTSQFRNPTSASTHLPTSGPPTAFNVGGYSPEPPARPRVGGPDDIRTMEDDLRRILKLNALS